MLKITIPDTELWDDKNEKFISIKGQTIQLEHSLVSISKWESKWHKAFLTKREKTYDETIDYIKCMTITQNVNPLLYNCLTNSNITEINNYIGNPMTATCLPEEPSRGGSKDVATSEVIYYWMIALEIPFECQKWHINRLLTLISVCNIKNKPPKKMGKGNLMRRNASLNAARRKRMNTKG